MSDTRLFDDNEAVALRLVGLLIGILLVAVISFAVMRGGAKPASAPAPVADVSGLRVDAALDGVVKIYFDTGKHEVGTLADAALTALVQELGDGRSVVISGFHDATGDPAMNAELAQQRALAVQGALLRLGAKPERLQLQKPLELSGGTDAAEARRVEVVLQ